MSDSFDDFCNLCLSFFKISRSAAGLKLVDILLLNTTVPVGRRENFSKKRRNKNLPRKGLIIEANQSDHSF